MTKLTPRPNQEDAVQLALAQMEPGGSRGMLLADEMGFGKTLIATEFTLRAMRAHGWTRVLLIALPNTHKQWATSFENQSEGAVHVRVMNGTKAGRENYAAFMKHEPGVYVAGSHYMTEKDWESVPDIDPATGRQIIKKDGKPKTKSVHRATFARFKNKPLDAVLVDETHVFASKSAHGRRTIYSIAKHAGFRFLMSGTWFLNNVANQWSIATLAWPGKNPATDEWWIMPANYHDWAERYLKSEPVRGKGGRVKKTPRGMDIMRVLGEKIPGEFASTLPAYRRLENEDRPPEPIIIRVPATPEQAAQMADLEEDLMTWVRGWDGQEAPLVVDIPLVLRMRLRQVCIAELSIDQDANTGEEVVTMADDAAGAKLGPLRWLIDERWPGQPVGILTDSRIGAHFITRRMQKAGYGARAWTGDLTQKEREELKEAFIAGEFDYLVGTIQSMGTGIDGLQRRANKVVWISEVDGNPALNEQALARYFRQGRKPDTADDHFEHVKLVIENSVDEISLENLLSKAWSMRAAMNLGAA